MLSICFQLSSQPLLDSMLIPESTGAEMKRVLQGMLKFDVKEGSSAKDTMMLIKGKRLPVLVQLSSMFLFNSLSTLHKAHLANYINFNFSHVCKRPKYVIAREHCRRKCSSAEEDPVSQTTSKKKARQKETGSSFIHTTGGWSSFVC